MVGQNNYVRTVISYLYSEFMTVRNIYDAFKEISAKNKILEQLSLKNGLWGSPKKRKMYFKNSDKDSPIKKTKFETMRHFWKQLEGNKSEDNFERKTLMGEPGPRLVTRGYKYPSDILKITYFSVGSPKYQGNESLVSDHGHLLDLSLWMLKHHDLGRWNIILRAKILQNGYQI